MGTKIKMLLRRLAFIRIKKRRPNVLGQRLSNKCINLAYSITPPQATRPPAFPVG